MVEPLELGRFISTCRKEKNLTQKQLGEELGVTDRAVSKWERGKSFPDISLIEPLLYKIQMIIYLLQIAAVAVLQIPFLSHETMCVNVICLAVWGALVFAADYLDKKIPEKKLRYSNPWIEGMFSVIYFLCYMLWFFLRKDEWRTLPMAEQMSLWTIIVVGSIVGFCVRVFLARKKRRSAV